MTEEQVAEIEMDLRRAAMDEPPDGRQRIVGQALRLLEAWKRSQLLLTAARDISTMRASELKTIRPQLTEAIDLLEGMQAGGQTERWIERKTILLRKARRP